VMPPTMTMPHQQHYHLCMPPNTTAMMTVPQQWHHSPCPFMHVCAHTRKKKDKHIPFDLFTVSIPLQPSTSSQWWQWSDMTMVVPHRWHHPPCPFTCMLTQQKKAKYIPFNLFMAPTTPPAPYLFTMTTIAMIVPPTLCVHLCMHAHSTKKRWVCPIWPAIHYTHRLSSPTTTMWCNLCSNDGCWMKVWSRCGMRLMVVHWWSWCSRPSSSVLLCPSVACIINYYGWELKSI